MGETGNRAQRVGSGLRGVRESGEAGEGVGPRVCGLASARDRARLRERQLAERARVERVLARGPREADAKVAGRGAGARRCRVCGGPDVVVDEVSDVSRDRSGWRLVRCLRCDDRAILPGAPVFAPRVRRNRPGPRAGATGSEGPRVREVVAG